MTPEQIIELAREADEVAHKESDNNPQADWYEIRDRHFATAVIKQHTAELLKDAGEPVAWATREADGSVYDCICHKEHDMFKRTHTLSLYTAEQVAAAVAQAYKQGKHDEEMTQGPSEFEGWERDKLLKRIATLESALKVAQDGLASIHTATAGSYSNIQEVLHD